jgi:uncharacterized protein (TIGR00369 family)
MSDNATITGHDEIMKRTIELFRGFPVPPGVTLELPPPSVQTLNIRYEAYVPATSLSATVAAAKPYGNAVGLLQGGIIAAMFDDVIGPLSYLTARLPTTSLDLTTHFLRPVFVGETVKLKAVVRKAGRTAIYVAAEAHNGGDKLVATAMSTLHVLAVPTS